MNTVRAAQVRVMPPATEFAQSKSSSLDGEVAA
jgi:hypothetical protein